jgi:hypothetical protein
MTKSQMRMKFGQWLSGCVMENHLVHLAFMCLIYYIGMNDSQKYGKNWFVWYKTVLKVKPFHRNSLMRFSVSF